VILTDGPVLDIESLPMELSQSRNSGDKSMSAFSMASAEKIHLQKVLNYTNGNKAEAARLLEIGIATLYRKIDEYKL
jgi:two-component system NtrC family response regulator